MQDDGSNEDAATREFDATVGALQGTSYEHTYPCPVCISPSTSYMIQLVPSFDDSCLTADILLDPTFEQVQTVFCKKHCQSFEVMCTKHRRCHVTFYIFDMQQ